MAAAADAAANVVLGPKWAVGLLTGVRGDASGLHPEAGLEVARKVGRSFEVFAQGTAGRSSWGAFGGVRARF